MYLFTEKAFKGGIYKRHSKVKNKDITNYDLTKPPKYIMYLGENNLHDQEMYRYLPYDKFTWLKNVDNFDVNSISENSSIQYILEGDFENP